MAGTTTIPDLNHGEFLDAPFIAPGLVEQRTIAAYLDRETSKIDALIAKIQQAIERLREYRTALISAAVTGKIDVRREGEKTAYEPQ
jgi:type I restriction enzyme S subunit